MRHYNIEMNANQLPISTPSKFLSGRMMFGIMGAVVLAIAIYAVYYYVFVLTPSLQQKYKPNSEHMSNPNMTSKSAEILFFHADWCPHCKVAMPIWEDFKKENQGKIINGYNIIFTNVDCSSTDNAESEQLIEQYNVEGYPTIKLAKDGQIISYEAKPTRETLNQFLNSMV
jgi:thiol-disulfide isomerase/thioredoxin